LPFFELTMPQNSLKGHWRPNANTLRSCIRKLFQSKVCWVWIWYDKQSMKWADKKGNKSNG
jgi:hypothetical protein